ncbi:MAG: L-glutamate gamma-semialdehyde dehydrogenase [Phycisphaerae bacterium]|nr:L-glutamate gamma-semialdehyde dehydrogenase [Phycisphaerae bacterium]
MPNDRIAAPPPTNEPVLEFRPGAPERADLDAAVKELTAGEIEIPLIIGGKEVRTGNTIEAVMPHRHGHVLARVHQAGPAEVDAAVDAAMAARHDWSHADPEHRAAVFLKAATLLAGSWRMKINAATMLNQSKTCHQAEIDAACEMIDFFRFNCSYMYEIYQIIQPRVSPAGSWNTVEGRGLEGFVYAITPFYFTSIAGNLPHAPALMGGTSVWKPSDSSLYSNYMVMRLFEAAGLPPGVINFVPGDAVRVSERLFAHPEFAGVHFTGSTEVFRSIWRTIGENLGRYRNYPRIVGETGGKNFVLAHPSANGDALIAALVRGAYEFQGQKCSAGSRAYIPRSVWQRIEGKLVSEIESIRMGDPTDYGNFMGAVIHRGAFDRCRRYIDQATSLADASIVTGGKTDDAEGYFVAPTLIRAERPDVPSMVEEIFGPILSVFVYDDTRFEEALALCDESTPYGLTGAIFAEDQSAISQAFERLRYAAGNFYINDKPTGAVVGQQPFGGARASGTNDKAGSTLNLMRWVSPRAIKETFDPPRDYRYPFLAQ